MEPESTSEYESDLALDPLQLEVEWTHQAALFDKWAKKWAYAEHKADKAKSKRKKKKAEIKRAVREKPKAHGWSETKAPTNDFLDEAIRINSEFQEIDNELIKATYEANIYLIAKEAFLHKRKALEHLTDLFKTSHYGAESSLPDSVKSKLAEVTGEALSQSLQEVEHKIGGRTPERGRK